MGLRSTVLVYFTEMAEDAKHLVEGSESSRVSDADGTASETRAGVAGLLRVSVVAAAEVINARVEDDTATNDRASAAEAEVTVGDVEDDGAVLVGNNVAEVTGMADLVLGSTVGLVEGVVVAAGGEAALTRDVAELVDVETVGGGGLEAGDLKVSNWLGVLMKPCCAQPVLALGFVT